MAILLSLSLERAFQKEKVSGGMGFDPHSWRNGVDEHRETRVTFIFGIYRSCFRCSRCDYKAPHICLSNPNRCSMPQQLLRRCRSTVDYGLPTIREPFRRWQPQRCTDEMRAIIARMGSRQWGIQFRCKMLWTLCSLAISLDR